jgi:CDGSH-type Zn-finger protein
MASERVNAGTAPLPIAVEAGTVYYWCSCGRSKKQPFCDGTHSKEATGLAPVKWQATETKIMYFCTCKLSKNEPLCDGSHKALTAA